MRYDYKEFSIERLFEPGHGISNNKYVLPAEPQTNLCIHAVWSEPLLVAWIFYGC